MCVLATEPSRGAGPLQVQVQGRAGGPWADIPADSTNLLSSLSVPGTRQITHVQTLDGGEIFL